MSDDPSDRFKVSGVIDAVDNHKLGVAKVVQNSNLSTRHELVEAVAYIGGNGRHGYRARIGGET